MIKICKSVGIITYHFAVNYGARLQAFALQKYLSTQGLQVSIINYLPIRSNYDILRICLPVNPANVFNSFNNILKIKKFNDKKVVLNVGKVYRTLAALKHNPPEHETYVSGSDQVWNPNCSPNNDIRPYLLDFGSNNSKRLAYAVSLGNCPEAVFENTKLWSPLTRMDSISVREADSVSKIQSLSKKDVQVCVDPTMLFSKSDYHKFFGIGEGFSENRFVAYFLNPRPLEVIPLLKKFHLSGFFVTQIFGGSFISSDRSDRVVPSPSGWVKYISESDGVITNSFHGVVFSIILNKRFLFLSLVGQEHKKNIRVTHLLKLLNLQERVVNCGNLEESVSVMMKPIKWAAVNKIVEELRLDSKQFLSVSLSL